MPKMILTIILAPAAVFAAMLLFEALPGTFRPAAPLSEKARDGEASDPAKPVPAAPQVISPILEHPAISINTSALREANDPGLRKLAEYETATGGVFSQMMIFTQLPVLENSAADQAASMAAQLKDYAALGVKPLVIVEPSTDDGGVVNFSKFAAGLYLQPLNEYFKALKLKGISDAQMGTWVPFPEPNTDSWGRDNSSPADFAAAFNSYAAVFKKYFPAASLSIMLDNQTYNYLTGDYEDGSLAVYLDGINKSYVSSFGLQGFPWAPARGLDDGSVIDASVFLGAGRAIAGAKALGVNSIWFNSGTFGAMYAQDPQKTVAMDAGRRGAILDSIFAQANEAKAAGFNVMVNIFAQNKSREDEAIDWSYWSAPADINGPSGLVLSKFASQAAAADISLSIFDAQ
jgi:hypothetical protein